jgi:FCD domain
VVSAKGHLDRTRRGGLKENNSTAPFADQHREIFDALVDRELRRVRDTMRKHLRAVFEDVERIRQRSPELFAAETARCRAARTSSSGNDVDTAAERESGLLGRADWLPTAVGPLQPWSVRSTLTTTSRQSDPVAASPRRLGRRTRQAKRMIGRYNPSLISLIQDSSIAPAAPSVHGDRLGPMIGVTPLSLGTHKID